MAASDVNNQLMKGNDSTTGEVAASVKASSIKEDGVPALMVKRVREAGGNGGGAAFPAMSPPLAVNGWQECAWEVVKDISRATKERERSESTRKPLPWQGRC